MGRSNQQRDQQDHRRTLTHTQIFSGSAKLRIESNIKNTGKYYPPPSFYISLQFSIFLQFSLHHFCIPHTSRLVFLSPVLSVSPCISLMPASLSLSLSQYLLPPFFLSLCDSTTHSISLSLSLCHLPHFCRSPLIYLHTHRVKYTGVIAGQSSCAAEHLPE